MTWVYNKDVATRALFCGCRPLAKPRNPLCSLFLASASLYYFILVINIVSESMLVSGCLLMQSSSLSLFSVVVVGCCSWQVGCSCYLVAVASGCRLWLSMLLSLVLWIQSIDIDLNWDSDLTTTQLGRSRCLAFVFAVLGRLVVIDYPPSILVVFGALDTSWWPFSCLVVVLACSWQIRFSPMGFSVSQWLSNHGDCSPNIVVALPRSLGSFQQVLGGFLGGCCCRICWLLLPELLVTSAMVASEFWGYWYGCWLKLTWLLVRVDREYPCLAHTS